MPQSDEPKPESPADRLRAAVAGKTAEGTDAKGRRFKRLAQVRAADVVAVAAPHLADPVAAALHMGATGATAGGRNADEIEVFQQVSDLNRLLELAGGS